MSASFRKTIALAVALLAAPPMPAQDAAPADPGSRDAESKTRLCRFAVASLPKGFGKKIFTLGPDGPVEVPLSLYRFSNGIPVAPDQKLLRLYRERPQPVGEPPAYPKPDLAVALDPKARQTLVVLFPREAGQGEFAIGAHAIDEAKFPRGSIYFFNPTRIHVAALLGEDKVRIAAGKAHLFKTPPLDEGKTFGVQIALHQEEGWKLFSSTRWHLTPRERHLVFFKINPRTRKPDYDSLTDYLD